MAAALLLLKSAWAFLAKLPWQVWASAAGILLCFACYSAGEHKIQVAWNAEKAANQEKVVSVQTQQATITTTVDQKTVAAEVQIKTVYRDRIVYQTKEVPYEVIVKEDSECVVPNRIVSMWNSANRGAAADAPSKSDEAASGVKLSDIEAQHEREAEAFQLNVQQIKGWQEWWSKQKALIHNGAAP